METLPLELLSTVFIHTLPTIRCHDPESNIRHDRINSRNFELVCRTWREMSLSTPELWTNIRITNRSDQGRIQIWLERARGCPLHLHVFVDDWGLEEGEDMVQCIELLRTKSDQWSTLQVIGRSLGEEDVRHIFPEELPNLTDAFIWNWFHDSEFVPYTSAPKLQRLTIGGEGPAVFQFKATPLLTRCTITEFGAMGNWRLQWHDFFANLGDTSPLLETLEVLKPRHKRGTTAHIAWYLPWPPLLKLTKLVFDGCHHETIAHILTHINAPALEVIHFSRIGYCHELPEPITLPCKAIIDQSRLCTIRRFLSNISNAQDVPVRVGFLDALRRLTRRLQHWEGRALALEGPESFAKMREHFSWFEAYARIEWALPGNVIVDGTHPGAFEHVFYAFWVWAYSSWVDMNSSHEVRLTSEEQEEARSLIVHSQAMVAAFAPPAAGSG